MTRRVKASAGRAPRTPAARLALAERLYRDFRQLTPHRFRPLAKTFRSFAEYERWRRDEADPWYR